jgi:glucosamine-6-phosphate deaminase
MLRVDGAHALAQAAADEVAVAVSEIAEPLIVFATGATPLGLFAELTGRVRSGALNLGGVRAVQLDEYVGLGPGDRRCLWDWLRRELLAPAGIDETKAIRFMLERVSADVACAEIDAAVDAAGGIDLAVLGLGPNGHVGFNEPPSPADSPTRRVRLAEESIAAGASYWGSPSDVPAEAVTLGLSTLLRARRIVLLVSGGHKREILHRTLTDTPSADVPASLLRTAASLLVIADVEALPLPPAVR